MNVTLKQVEAFLALASTLSFSKAAVVVHLSQPAFSTTIQQLEASIGGRLFDRDTRTVELTPLGCEFAPLAAELSASVLNSLSHIRSVVAGKRGRLTLAVSPSVAASFLPSVMACFAAAYPDVEVALHDVLAERALEKIRGKSVDLALMPRSESSPDLIQRDLLRDEIYFLCSAASPLARRRSVSWEDVLKTTQIARKGGSDMRRVVEQAFLARGVQFQPAFEVENVGTMLGLIVAGLGCGVMPRFTVQSANTRGLAVIPFTSRDRLSRQICAVTLRSRARNQIAENFLALCMEKGASGIGSALSQR